MSPLPKLPRRCDLVPRWSCVAMGWVLLLAMQVAMAQDGPLKVEGPYPPKPGETCAVCNSGVTAADVAYLVDGQRVAIRKEMEAEFLADPGKFLRMYQPESMLFTASMPARTNWTLFVMGVWVLLGLLFGALSAQTAMSKGYPGGVWFFYGLAVNVAAWMSIQAKPALANVTLPPGLAKLPVTSAPADCPHCGKGNHPSARRCSACGEQLNAAVASEADLMRGEG